MATSRTTRQATAAGSRAGTEPRKRATTKRAPRGDAASARPTPARRRSPAATGASPGAEPAKAAEGTAAKGAESAATKPAEGTATKAGTNGAAASAATTAAVPSAAVATSASNAAAPAAAAAATSSATTPVEAPTTARSRRHARTLAADENAVADLVETAADNAFAFNPLIGIDVNDVAHAAQALLKVVSESPTRATQAYVDYLGQLGQIVTGKSDLAADPKDRRFNDEAWKSNRFYHGLMQAYLATQRDMLEFIDGSTLDTREKGRAKYFASLITDALAPSNWLLGNPAAVRKLLDTGGTHLIDGMKNLVHDATCNRMMPSQVNAAPFKVGENVATTPGEVVLRHELFELIQYTPTTPNVYARPLVMSPPQVNKYYAVDLSPEKSLVKWAIDSGVQFFMISWRNPTVENRDWGLDTYVHAIDAAVDAAREITGSPDVSLWGSCSGGMSAAAYLGWLAGRGEKKVVNATWAVCVLDMSATLEDTTLGLFTTPTTVRTAQARSRRKGIVDGNEMASMFAWLRPNDLVWNYWVNNYLLGNQPPAFDILAWNADTTRLPGRYHCDLLEMMVANPYMNAGALDIDGVPIDMNQVHINAYVIGGMTDHITPWKACYGTARIFGPESTFVLANAGHLQSLVSPPGSTKAYYFVGPANVPSADEWAAEHKDDPHQGSWWPNWRGWIQARSGPEVPAPKSLGSKAYPPLMAAPGEYVLET